MSVVRNLFPSRFVRALPAVIIGLGFVLTSFTLPAQEDSSQTIENSEQAKETSASELMAPEVIVSASRVPVPAKHIGSSVTVIDAEAIEQRQPSFVHELLREVPSLAISQSGATGGNTQVRIRGAEANHTLVVVDGLDMGNPFSGDEFQLQHMPVSSIQSIEILRGPQSAIHGSESIGGVISITTPIPKQKFEASVSTELGIHRTRNAKAYVGTADDNFYAAITASHFESDGGASARTHNSEKDGFVNQYLHLKSGFQVAENFNLSAVFIGIDSESEYDDYLGAASSWYSGTDDYVGKDQKRLVGTTLQYNQDDDPVTHKFSWSKSIHKRKEFKDAAETSSSRGESRRLLYQGTLNYQAFNLQNSTTFAAEQKDSKVQSESLSHPDGGKFKLRSYVLEHRLNFDDIGFFSVSGRWDDSQDDVFASRNTYRIAGAWILNEQMRFHGSYGTGVKNPTIQDIFGWTTEWKQNSDIRPETSRGWDLGIEKEFNDGAFTIDATYFHNKIKNLINIFNCVSGCKPAPPGGPDPDGASVYQSINTPGTSRIKGIELSARGSIGDGYDISAQLTHSDGVDAKQKKLSRRPTRTASLNLNKDVPIFGYEGNVNLNVQHTGKQLDNNGTVELRSFTIADLSATLQITPNCQITAKINNLFDKDSYAEVQGYGVAGRSLHVGVRYEF